MVRSFADIDAMIANANLGSNKILAVPAADELHVLEAVWEAKKLGLTGAILIGDRMNIIRIARENSIHPDEFEIIHCTDAAESSQIAVDLVRNGRAHIILKGLLDTVVFLKAVLNKERGLRGDSLLSHAAIFEVTGFDRLIIITDPAINLEPSLEEKEMIMKNAVALAHALGNGCPKVGFVAPVEKVNSRMDSTMHAKALVDKYAESRSFLVGGPFGLDNAISEEAALIKGISGPVAGKADILIVNDLGVGNVIYKAMVYFAHAKHAGIVIGAKAPILITSRADSSETKVNCIKLAILLSDHYQSLHMSDKGA